eukprot:s4705_g1.t1
MVAVVAVVAVVVEAVVVFFFPFSWWLAFAFLCLWCQASVCSLAWWWSAFARLWCEVCLLFAGVVVVDFCSPLMCGQRLFAGVVAVGVCSSLVLGGLLVVVASLCWLAGLVVGVCPPCFGRS